MRLAPSARRGRWQAESLLAATSAVTRQPGWPWSFQTSPRTRCWAPWSKVPGHRGGRLGAGSGGGGVAHDLEVEQALGAHDTVDGTEQQGERAGLSLGNQSGKRGRVADQAGG